MKTEQPILITTATIPANSFDPNFTIPKNVFVGLDGYPVSSGDQHLGVSSDELLFPLGTESQQMPVIVSGIALVKTGAAITKGAKVISDDDGKAIPFEEGIDVLGIALDAASAADQLIRVLLK